jgi:hypothetical protein
MSRIEYYVNDRGEATPAGWKPSAWVPPNMEGSRWPYSDNVNYPTLDDLRAAQFAKAIGNTPLIMQDVEAVVEIHDRPGDEPELQAKYVAAERMIQLTRKHLGDPNRLMFFYGLPLTSIAMYKLFAPVIRLAGVVHVYGTVMNSPGRSDEYIGGPWYGTSLESDIEQAEDLASWVSSAREFKGLPKLLYVNGFYGFRDNPGLTEEESPFVPYTKEALVRIERLSRLERKRKRIFSMLHYWSATRFLDTRILRWSSGYANP